jgi:hypothetical protein
MHDTLNVSVWIGLFLRDLTLQHSVSYPGALHFASVQRVVGARIVTMLQLHERKHALCTSRSLHGHEPPSLLGVIHRCPMVGQ